MKMISRNEASRCCRHISLGCILVSSLTFFLTKNDCIVYGYDSAAFNIRKNVQDSVRLNCTTDSKSSVDWQFKKTSDSKRVDIFIGNARGGGGQKSNLYLSRKRYQIEMNIQLGRYDLLIINVSKIDEGFYECSDVSNPDSSTIWKLIVIGGEEEELCSNDVTAIVGETVRLIFPTTKKDSIQLEHRSVDHSQILHVFYGGRLVNDYYTQSGRYDFSASNSGWWTLVIKDAQTSDAGSFICSEYNGLGQQYAKELVVITENDVSCSTENETCAGELNVTCKATYVGNCTPRLLLSTEGGTPLPRNENRVIIIGKSVSLMTVANRTHVPLCVVTTQSTSFNSTCQVSVCKGTTIEHVSHHNIIISITVLLICLVIIICSVTFFTYVIMKRRASSHGYGEICCFRKRTESQVTLVERPRMVNR